MKKSIQWGLLCIGIAALIIASSLNLLHGFGFWTIFLTAVFVCSLIDGLLEFSVANIIFSSAFLYIIWDKPMGWPEIPAVNLLIAALFATIGFDMLFKRYRIRRFKEKHVNEFKKHVDIFEKDVERFGENFEKKFDRTPSGIEYDAGENIYCKSKFGGMKKYVTSQNLKSIVIDVSFGAAEIYLDQANAPSGEVDMEIDVSFGAVKLYLPKNWSFENNFKSMAGAVSEKGEHAQEGIVRVKGSGDIDASAVEIRYI
jgi:predicted membrane protein